MLWKYIIILILFVPCCLICDSTVVYTKEIIPKTDKPKFLGVDLNFNQGFDYKTIAIGYKAINTLTREENFQKTGIEINPLYFSWTTKDKTSYSYLSIFTLSYLGVIYLTKEIGIFDEDGKTYESLNGIGFIFNIITNPKLNYTIYNLKIDNNNFITTSGFANIRFDYFVNNDEKWLRFKPALGLEIDYIAVNSPIGVGIEFGYDKAFDSGVKNSNAISPFIGIKLLLGNTTNY